MGMVFYFFIAERLPFDCTETDIVKILNNEKPEIDPSWHRGYIEVSRIVCGGKGEYLENGSSDTYRTLVLIIRVDRTLNV